MQLLSERTDRLEHFGEGSEIAKYADEPSPGYKSKKEVVDMNITERRKQFSNPDASYRGKPFWAWNGRLEKEELFRQIDVMKEMGFGGYFMHSRTGLETEYLGEEWFELTRSCAEYGHKADMESWLYDEDRWPSGSAGGMVTKEVKYRAMYLEMRQLGKDEWAAYREPEFEKMNLSEERDAVDTGKPVELAAAFACRITEGLLQSKRSLAPCEALAEDETAVIFEIRYAVCNDNYNGYCYLNTMNREAVEAYLESTHEKYSEKCGDMLGKEISGIFTDEPHRGGAFTEFGDGGRCAVPYTPGLFETFEERFGYSLTENLPELFLRYRENELSKVKHDYFELCQELFIECFARPIADWCKEHKLIFTGHVLHEDSLCAQATMQGSLMRFYEYMDYPGIDLLGEYNYCYWVAKQVVSVARQLDKKWVLSELYGCTGWQMNFQSYKNIGDWQAIQGINLRCPHLSWYTMKGEAKRDYPASILHQSAWYHDYSYLEDYFSRIHVALGQGKPVCGLLVINPIESVWSRAYSGAFSGLSPEDEQIKRLEWQYQEVYTALVGHQIDFDYGEEDILSRHGRVENGILYVGQSAYKKVLVAGVDTARTSTLKLLQKFQEQGGTVIFAGEVPAYLDAQPSKHWETLAEHGIRIPFEQEAIGKACASGAEVKVDSEIRPKLMTQVCQIEKGRCIMLLNTDREQDYEKVQLRLGKGMYLEQWDARTGKILQPEYSVEEGNICLTIDLERGGERIYMIMDEPEAENTGVVWKNFRNESDKEKESIEKQLKKISGEALSLEETFDYTLSEANVCVMDMVSVTSEEGASIPRMEVLKADRHLRAHYKIPYRSGGMLQPWYQVKYADGNTECLGVIRLTYDVCVEALPQNVSLVVEDLKHIRRITVNGVEINLASNGKWVDIAFEKLQIPDGAWRLGENTVEVVMEYYGTNGIEAVYLLGSFGVRVAGWKRMIGKLPDKLKIGNICDQGLPFYSGSVNYHVNGMCGKKVSVKIPAFGGALVKLQGQTEEIIAFAPYEASVEDLHTISVVLTRRNTFGPLHALPKKAKTYGPGNFLTEGGAWSDDYVLYEQGLLETPVVIQRHE